MTPEERQDIIDEAVAKAVEKALLALPDAWANLIADHKAMSETAAEFYKRYPEFKGHGKVVAGAVGEMDGKHPFLNLKDKYEKAVPVIRDRLKRMEGLDTNVNPSPDLAMRMIEPPKVDLGEL